MALNLLIVLEGQQVDERLQEAGFNNWRFVLWVDGYVANTSGSREDEREVRRLQEAKEMGKAIALDNFELVLL